MQHVQCVSSGATIKKRKMNRAQYGFFDKHCYPTCFPTRTEPNS